MSLFAVFRSILVRSMKRGMVAATLMIILLSSGAGWQSLGSAMPAEVKKTVEVFAGHWTLRGTDVEPAAKGPVNFGMTMECKPTALGAAVTCRFAGKLPPVGPIEAAAVIGYNPEEQVVRWMEISSTGEYHDHRGRWKGDQIEFEPLEYSIAGKKATEYLQVSFPGAGELKLTSVTETAEGESVLKCRGTRVESMPSTSKPPATTDEAGQDRGN